MQPYADRMSCTGLCFRLVLVVMSLVVASCVEFDAQERSYTFSQNLLAKDLPDNIRLVRLGAPEEQGGVVYRWGMGPESLVIFAIPWERTLKFELALSGPIENLGVEVAYNGEALKRVVFTAPEFGAPQRVEVVFEAEPGVNVISLQYSNYNNKDSNFLGDSRPLAVRISELTLTEYSKQP